MVRWFCKKEILEVQCGGEPGGVERGCGVGSPGVGQRGLGGAAPVAGLAPQVTLVSASHLLPAPLG